MRFVLVLSALAAIPVANASAHECDAVLIPSISAFEHETRMALDTLSVIQSNSSEKKSTKDQYAVTVPIYGVPVQFGYQNDQSSEFRNRTLNYFKQNLTSGSNLTFESRMGFPADSTRASLAHANRDFHHSQAR
jgi:hypothetical protein